MLRIAVTPIIFIVSGLAATFSFNAGWMSLWVLMGPVHYLVGRYTRTAERAAGYVS